MPSSNEAEEHLRVIRGLMERSTIYRAISAPTALVGGLLSVAAALYSVLMQSKGDETQQSWTNQAFFPLWISVLVITLLFNTYSLWAKARRMKELFLSAGLKLACRMAFPSYFTAALTTVLMMLTMGIGGYVQPSPVAFVWLVCHGLGLLSTQAFAPKSIFFLGWAFLLSGLLYICIIVGLSPYSIQALESTAWGKALIGPLQGFLTSARRYMEETPVSASYLLGLTFGGYHLIYAYLTWPHNKTSFHPEGSSLE